jgi:type IV pilus assembly protein PilC
MPLISTPKHFVLRAQFYQQFSQLMAAGLPIIKALEMLAAKPPAPSYRAPLNKLVSLLKEGSTVSDAVEHLGDWMPRFDIALVQAGEHSGRLDSVFKTLAGYYNDRAVLLRQVLWDLAYPVFVFHMAIFVFPFVDYLTNPNGKLFLLKTFGVLIPLYVAIFAFIKSMEARRSERWRAFVERVLHAVPLLGPGREFIALARLSTALGALLNAGVNIIQAWELAAEASGSPILQRTIFAWRPQVEAGQTPSEAINKSGKFPELFANLYHAGEMSGQLDDSLNRVRIYYQDEGGRKLHMFGQVVSKTIYFGVAGYVAYKVIHFWTGYFNQIRQAGGF